MVAHVFGNSHGFREWSLRVNDLASFNWRSLEEESFLFKNRQG